MPYIAPFALSFATLIFIISAIYFVRKKIWREGKKWIGVPTSLGVLALLVFLSCMYYTVRLWVTTPIITIFIWVLLIAEIRYRIRKGQRNEYQIVAKEKNWQITAGKISPIIILMGAVILLFYPFYKLFFVISFYDKLETLFTCLWSGIALIGIILGLRGIKIARFICLIAGIIATAGMFIPINITVPGYYTSVYNLSGSTYYFDPILILIGGIIGVASKDEFLKYYINKYEFRLDKISLIEEMDKIDDLKTFLKEKLSSDWEKIKISFKAYKAGELEKDTFIRTALKNVGNKFFEIFEKQGCEKLNEP
ncbi:MAG: hypothetical protein ACFFEY_18335 [Candidatus Thorarchaeota archaeon]